jgi:FdhE protein
LQLDIQADKDAMEKRFDLLEKDAASGKLELPVQMIQLLREVCREQIRIPPEIEIQIDEQEKTDRDKHLNGVPLLLREKFPVDRPRARELFNKLLRIALDFDGPIKDAAEVIEKEVTDLEPCWRAFINGDDDFFLRFGEKTPQSPRMLNFLIQSSLIPSLEAAGKELNSERPDGGKWEFGSCPVCGSLPLMGSLRGKEGTRYMTCSFCHTDYHVPRLGCPFCMQADKSLDYFTADDYPGFRVDVCGECERYIKIADFREMDRKHLPILDDLETVALDAAAQDQGYSRPTLSGWGF